MVKQDAHCALKLSQQDSIVHMIEEDHGNLALLNISPVMYAFSKTICKINIFMPSQLLKTRIFATQFSTKNSSQYVDQLKNNFDGHYGGN